MKRIVGAIAALVVLLAGLSYLTTRVVWDGGYPSGLIPIDVREKNGQPIPGAVLRIYHAGTHQLAFGYPITNQTPQSSLTSDQSGRIVAVQERGGLQFGGFRWELFWIIPMGKRSGPQFDCEISAPNHTPASFDIWRLFESPYKMYNDFPKAKYTIDGKEEEFKVYSQTFTLAGEN